MPHFVLELSDNIQDRIDVDRVLKSLHETLVSSGPFAMSSIKSRVIRHESYRVGNGDRANTFVHLSLAILPGRDENCKKEVAKALFAELKKFFPKTITESPHSITCEIRELDDATYQKQSNLTEGEE